MSDMVHEGCSLGDLVVRAIQRYPDRVALVQDGSTVTYRQLGARISQVIQVFEARGLSRGDGIAHLTNNAPEEFYVAAAAYCAGYRYVPLHPLGSANDFRYIVEHSEASSVIIQTDSFRDVAIQLQETLSESVSFYSHGEWKGATNLFAEASNLTAVALRSVSSSADTARIAYTGGTTGRPKGVVQSHRAMVTNTLLSLTELEWPEDIRFLCCTPLSHATGYLIIPTLLRGGTLFLQTKFTPQTFCESVERHRTTCTLLVPTMIYGLLDYPQLAEFDLSSLDLVIYGAAPISPTRLAEALHRIGPVFQQSFGLTESPNCIATLKKSDHQAGDERRLSSCGTPYVGNQVTVRSNDGQEVQQGQVGEVCLRSPLIMDGYWKQPAETAEAFSGGWFHTGDMGYQDIDGYLYLVDRKKDLIISGGFNIYAREVEDALSTHPSVAQAAVIGVPDQKWGEAVKALVVRRPGTNVSAEELIALVKSAKGSVQAPKSVDFVQDLPVTAVGKLDKKGIRAAYWQHTERQIH